MVKKWVYRKDPKTGLDILVTKPDPQAIEKVQKIADKLFREPCDLTPGDIGCEECDDWIIVDTLPPSPKHPIGFAVQKCRRLLDKQKGEADK